MINTFTITNSVNESITYNIKDPYSNKGSFIAKIDGIGPVTADINMSDTSTFDGAMLNSTHIQTRTITFSIAIFPWEKSIEQERQRLYRYIPTKQKVKLRFVTDFRVAEIEGYVESVEVSIFTPFQSLAVSVICPNPFFKSANVSETRFYGGQPLLEFGKGVLFIPQDSGIELSSVNNSTRATMYYGSEAENGVVIHAKFTGPASGLKFYNVSTEKFIEIDDAKLEKILGSKFTEGDELYIYTEVGHKAAYVIRGTEKKNIINAITRTSSWFNVVIGYNVLSFTAAENSQNVKAEITADVLYGGL